MANDLEREIAHEAYIQTSNAYTALDLACRTATQAAGVALSMGVPFTEVERLIKTIASVSDLLPRVMDLGSHALVVRDRTYNRRRRA